MQKIILHLDFDSFFASCEQQFRPELRGKPIGVTATNGRTCIIAASREAKRKGVKSPSNIYAAQQICPTLQLVGADFNKYWEVSKKFILICKDFSPFVEVFSLDELFMDVTMTAHLFGGVENLIQRVKQRIAAEIGEYITVSVGISHNKMLAKMGSGLKKPNGVVFITPDNLWDIYATADLTDICGIGERIRARLNMMGISTLLQLRKTPIASLIAEFGNVEGHFLYNVGQGVDTTRVKPFTQSEEVKSVGRQHCLAENQYDMRVVFQQVYELFEEISIKLRRLEKKARLIGMHLSGSVHVSVHKTYGSYINTAQEMFDLSMQLLKHQTTDFYCIPEELRYVRRIGVYAAHLYSEYEIPESLFPRDNKKQRLIRVVDKINDKFGHHTIRNGFLLYANKLTSVPNGFGPDTYERQKMADWKID